MLIGIPKEIKDHETRVPLTPGAVKKLIQFGHEIWIEKNAGLLSGFPNQEYQKVGATVVHSAQKIYGQCPLVVKVKEPLISEYKYFHKRLTLFCFLHLAANSKLTQALLENKVTALGFETLMNPNGQLPLLQPMSEIAGRLSVSIGMNYLRSDLNGRGILLSPTNFSPAGRVCILGGGNVGRAAAEVAIGLRAQVELIEKFPQYIEEWKKKFPQIKIKKPSVSILKKSLSQADLVIGATAIPGAKTPKLITTDMIKNMKHNAVFVDVAVDQGGSSETTQVTNLSQPTYRQFNVIHYAVPNIPAMVGRTSSEALSKVLLLYLKKLASRGYLQGVASDKTFASALQMTQGEIIHPSLMEIYKG